VGEQRGGRGGKTQQPRPILRGKEIREKRPQTVGEKKWGGPRRLAKRKGGGRIPKGETFPKYQSGVIMAWGKSLGGMLPHESTKRAVTKKAPRWYPKPPPTNLTSGGGQKRKRKKLVMGNIEKKP